MVKQNGITCSFIGGGKTSTSIHVPKCVLRSVTIPKVTASKVALTECTHQLVNPNLYTGTKDWSGTWQRSGHWTLKNEYYNGCRVASRYNAWDGLYHLITLPAGHYTLSAWIKASDGVKVHSYPRPYENTIYTGFTPPNYQNVHVGDGKWHRLAVTYYVSGTAQCGFRFESGTDGEICVAGLKLEQGTKATPWCPAEADNASTFSLRKPPMQQWGTGYEESETPEYAVE